MCIMIIRLVNTELIIEQQPVWRRLRVIQCEKIIKMERDGEDDKSGKRRRG